MTIAAGKRKIQLALFNFYNSQKKFNLAETQIKKLVADYPEDVDVAILLGTFYLHQEKQTKPKRRT